jgi:Fe-S-cluster containining protein
VSETDANKWYRNGLRFECTHCGKCCGGAPGFVWVTAQDIARFAERLNMREDEIRKRYVRRVWGRLSLTEKSNGDCIMLEEKRCRVYDVRPVQCVTFPFWRQNLRTKDDWDRLADECPGINAGPLISFEAIEDALKEDF